MTIRRDQPLVFDAHLDLSMNAMEWNRDLRWTVEDIRASEAGMGDKRDRAAGTVSFPAMRAGNLGLCAATLIARHVKRGNALPGWHSPEQAWAQTRGQLAWYRAMEDAGQLVQIRDTRKLTRHIETWTKDPAKTPIGYILTLEGADSIRTLADVEHNYADGLRLIGPAHYGPGTYAQGTDADGGIGTKGRELLAEMERLGNILDATHLCDQSFREALDCFGGRVWASHSNCRSLVPDKRQFTDAQIKELIARDAVIGVALDAWMLAPNWIKGASLPKEMGVTIASAVDHIDRICQLAGNARHAAIGTDLDGGYGLEQSPYDLDTIADLQKIPPLLKTRGYGAENIAAIMSGNCVRFLKDSMGGG